MSSDRPWGAPEPEADVVAAGTVPWRRTGEGGFEVAVVHRPRYDDWSLPKGHQDTGEAITETAVRETREEAGLDTRLGARLGHSGYRVDGASKIVHYWAAELVTDHGFAANEETDRRRWVSPTEAAGLLSYPHDAELVRRLDTLGAPSSTVLLVRHAKAGNRASWDGDDDRRPLSGTGHAQADRLADFLRRFGPDRLCAAPPLRCRQTLEPLAEAIGLAPEADERLLGEQHYWDDPDAGLARFRRLAAVPGVTALCSQGGVIPDVVQALLSDLGHATSPAPSDEMPSHEVPSHKASTWVLGIAADGTLRSADYYRRAPS